MITRNEALKKCTKENLPRLKDVEDYCKLINISFVDLVNSIRTLRHKN
jgi:hypothetical protein